MLSLYIDNKKLNIMSESSFKHLRVEDQDHIRRIVLCNPKQLNALHRALLEELSLAIEALYSEKKQLWGAIIQGEGGRAFAAGANIKEFEDLSPTAAAHLARRGQQIFQRIEEGPIPVVAAVQGFALGGGCELAMACHLRVAAPSARFGQPELRLGLIPGYGGTQRLVQLIGKTKAMEWILTGETYTAEEALRVGLVNHVVETEEALLPYAQALLSKVAKGSPEAVSAAISCIHHAAAAHAYEAEAKAFANCAATENFQEGVSAFLQKRKANFSGR